MPKGIYSLKTCIFRKQFQLTPLEARAARKIKVFAVTVNLKRWFEAPVTVDAPVNDLEMCEQLDRYTAVDSEVGPAALKKFRGHLWYLSEGLAPSRCFQ